MSPDASRRAQRITHAKHVWYRALSPWILHTPTEHELGILAQHLHMLGILTSLNDLTAHQSGPRMYHWSAQGPYGSAGGLSIDASTHAKSAALAEIIERAVWKSDDSVFTDPGSRARIPLHAFAGYSQMHRATSSKHALLPESAYRWVEGYSWTERTAVAIPLQTVSGIPLSEPLIRPRITTGLATAPSYTEAVHKGALEIIERDAFMIMWRNRLALPKIPHEYFRDAALLGLLRACKDEGIAITFVRLITDAPAYVMCAVARHESRAPSLTLGLAAHQNIANAARKALLESLRARKNYRKVVATEKPGPPWSGKRRALFWGNATHAPHGAFLTDGPFVDPGIAPWETQSTTEHLESIAQWCNDNAYTLASVKLSHSPLNVSPWHCASVVIPQAQPLHQNERFPAYSGSRMERIPLQWGYQASVHEDSVPHPFI